MAKAESPTSHRKSGANLAHVLKYNAFRAAHYGPVVVALGAAAGGVFYVVNSTHSERSATALNPAAVASRPLPADSRVLGELNAVMQVRTDSKLGTGVFIQDNVQDKNPKGGQEQKSGQTYGLTTAKMIGGVCSSALMTGHADSGRVASWLSARQNKTEAAPAPGTYSIANYNGGFDAALMQPQSDLGLKPNTGVVPQTTVDTHVMEQVVIAGFEKGKGLVAFSATAIGDVNGDFAVLAGVGQSYESNNKVNGVGPGMDGAPTWDAHGNFLGLETGSTTVDASTVEQKFGYEVPVSDTGYQLITVVPVTQAKVRDLATQLPTPAACVPQN